MNLPDRRTGGSTERRYMPSSPTRDRVAVGVGVFGSLLLGAGVMASLMRDGPRYAAALLAVGAVLFVVGLGLLRRRAPAIRIGDLGIGFERAVELVRIRWCDVDSLSLDHGALVLSQGSEKYGIPLGEHKSAALQVIREAVQRIPTKVALDEAQQRELTPASESPSGELVALVPLQVTGKTYADTGKSVTLERDTLRCKECAALYHKDGPPGQCSLCGHDLDGSLVPV